MAHSAASQKIQLGLEITQGLGAGARPEVGKMAAEEAKDKIADITKRIKCLEEIDKMVMTIWALSNNNAAKATAVFRDSKAGKSGKFEYK